MAIIYKRDSGYTLRVIHYGTLGVLVRSVALMYAARVGHGSANFLTRDHQITFHRLR
jgi:hypothetical protein